jgi:serine/threonine-protein phosphatase PGAM5
MRTFVVVGALFAGFATMCVGAESLQTGDGGCVPGVKTVYLVRHGEYDRDDDRDPTIGKGLVPLGVAQARLVGARLRAMPVDFTSLYSSTMTRARETALVIGEDFPELELEVSPLLSECTPPIDPVELASHLDPHTLTCCQERLDEAFSTFFRPSCSGDRHDVVVCHGNMIRYLVMKALGVNAGRWYAMSIANCSLTVITITPAGSMLVRSFSETGHLPETMTTRTFPAVDRDLRVPGGPLLVAP